MIDPIPDTRPVFSRADYDTLKDAQRAISELLPRFDRAAACGVNCEAMRQYIADTHRQLLEIEAQWMTPYQSR